MTRTKQTTGRGMNENTQAKYTQEAIRGKTHTGKQLTKMNITMSQGKSKTKHTEHRNTRPLQNKTLTVMRRRHDKMNLTT